MAYVRVEQCNAHLAAGVRLEHVKGRDGPLAKATLTAISNHRRGSRGDRSDGGGDSGDRDEESTAIQWVLWGKQAENAAEYLGKGSHVNIVGRLRNNNYQDADGADVYALAFTADEIDYLETRAESDARRARAGGRQGAAPGATPVQQPGHRDRSGASNARRTTA